MKRDNTITQAMTAWEYLAYHDCATDIAVNDLLRDCCKMAGTPYYTIEDNPIYFSIFNMPKYWRVRFINACADILDSEEEYKGLLADFWQKVGKLN